MDSVCLSDQGHFCCCDKHPDVFKGGALLKEFVNGNQTFPIGTRIVTVDVNLKDRVYYVELGPWGEWGEPTGVAPVPMADIKLDD